MDGLYIKKSDVENYDLFKNAVEATWPEATIEKGAFKNSSGPIENKEELYIIKNTGVTENKGLQYGKITVKATDGVIANETEYLTIENYEENNGTSEKPYQLEPNSIDLEDIESCKTLYITEIDLGGCDVNMGHDTTYEAVENNYVNSFLVFNEDVVSPVSYLYSTTSIKNGTILNDNCICMFYGSLLSSIDINFPNLVNSMGMFYGSSLSSVNISLPNLTTGEDMFGNCNKLTNVQIKTTQSVIDSGVLTKSKLGIDTEGTFQYSVDDGETWIDIPD